MEYTITGRLVSHTTNAAMSEVHGRCQMLNPDGTHLKWMNGKLIHLRYHGSSTDAIESLPSGPTPARPNWDPGYYSIAPLANNVGDPRVGDWEIAVEDFRGWSDWVRFQVDAQFVEVNFTWVPAGAEPAPDPDPDPAPVSLDKIRNEAYCALGIDYNPDAALLKYARDKRLGSPVTEEFDIGDTRVQGFALAIVYCVIGDWGNVQQMEWSK